MGVMVMVRVSAPAARQQRHCGSLA